MKGLAEVPKIRSAVEDVTVVIKTWKRDDCCNRLIKTIRDRYPTQPIVIINDGNKTVWEDDNMKTVLFDTDIGVARGRNEGMKAVDTKYAVMCDDDFLFSNDTNLALWKDIFIENNMDILAGFPKGDSINKDGSLNNMGGLFVPYRDGWTIDWGKYHAKNDDVVFTDLLQQFLFLDVAVVLEAGGWDERLQMCEHFPFFLTMKKKGLVCGYTNKINSGGHDRETKNKDYDRARYKKQGMCVSKYYKQVYKLYNTDYPGTQSLSRKTSHPNVKRLRKRRHKRRI